jgi:hypothetical protein
MLTRPITMLLLLAALFASCSQQIDNTKFHPGDPFAKYLPASQVFTIAPGADTALMGKYGTGIVALKNSFMYPDGSPVEGPVELSLSEGHRLSDMVLGNIAAPEGGSSAIHIEAQDAQGRKLRFNPEAPLLIETPVAGKLHATSLLRGERAPDGSMQWKEPKPIPRYLRTVPLETLDFLPPGFTEKVDEGMPMFGQDLAGGALVDSLYYAVREHRNPIFRYNQYVNYVDGKHATPCWHPEMATSDSLGHGNADKPCPIDPAQIKAMRTEAFKNSFVSTREFAQRVKALHQTCGREALELYLSNLT